MTTSDYLTMAETRFMSSKRDYPNSPETERLADIVAGMVTAMTPDEHIAHLSKTIETPAMKDARLKEERRVLIQMAMNKDSSSI